MQDDSDYLIVLPIEPIPERESYGKGKSLPMHCTVMQWFHLGEMSVQRLQHELMLISSHVGEGAIVLTSERPALFGPGNDVPVHTLAPVEDLMRLHTEILLVLAKYGAKLPREVHWMGAGYKPHVTSSGASFLPGTKHLPEFLTLIRRDASGTKKVLREHRIGEIPF